MFLFWLVAKIILLNLTLLNLQLLIINDLFLAIIVVNWLKYILYIKFSQL